MFIRYILTAKRLFSGVAGWPRERRWMDHADDSTLRELGFYAPAGSPDSGERQVGVRDLAELVLGGQRSAVVEVNVDGATT